jgi:hypothetical protein
MAFTGVIDEGKQPGERISFDNVGYLWRPRDLLTQVYGWGTAGFDAELLLRRVGNLAACLNIPVALISCSDKYHDIDPDVDTSGNPVPLNLGVPVIRQVLNGAGSRLALSANIAIDALQKGFKAHTLDAVILVSLYEMNPPPATSPG